MRIHDVLGICLSASLAVAGAANADYRLEKMFDLAAGGEVSLRTEAGRVEVRGAEVAQARVVIESSRDDFERVFEVRFEQPSPGRLEVTVERRGRNPMRWLGWQTGSPRIEVEVPRSASAEIDASGGSIEVIGIDGRLRAESSGGRIDAERIGGDVVLSSSGGGVEVVGVGGSARLRSSGGSISARDVRGDIDAGSSGGGVRIDEAGGEVVASSSGGPVKVGFAAGNAQGGDLHSSGGSVEARVDASVGLDIDASSSGGSISCDLPVAVRGRLVKGRLQGKLNAGGAVLKLRASGGGISIEER